jgi:hypothetical protein
MANKTEQQNVLAVETSCRRVTAEDLQSVTVEDVERIARTISPEEFRAALRVLADHNKTSLVLAESSPDAMTRALTMVTPEMVKDARAKTTTSSAMQAMLLASATEHLRATSAEVVKQMQEAGDLF